ncbi:MAG: sigma-70 family RNA polymerase sigma factor [Chitinophagaceae bacterium]|nr:MAG: sigma-70 family RNA polymerase sigma factor [Chitinophagaceae bacterium]
MKAETNILAAVVRRAGTNDPHAQGILYEQFSKAMFNTCLRITANRHDAEDLLQESFLIAFRSIHQLRFEKNFGGWLKKIVINECLRYCRKKIRWTEINEEDLGQSDVDDSNWLEGIPAGRINEAIASLPDACRTIFNLYAIEDYSHREIAEALGLSEGTSKSQYHRARQLLRTAIIKASVNG